MKNQREKLIQYETSDPKKSGRDFSFSLAKLYQAALLLRFPSKQSTLIFFDNFELFVILKVHYSKKFKILKHSAQYNKKFKMFNKLDVLKISKFS